MTVKQFDEIAKRELSDADFGRLTSYRVFSSPVPAPREWSRIYREYHDFDTFLRAKIAKRRADRAGVLTEFPALDRFYIDAEKQVAQAAAAPNPLERAKVLDVIRWQYLDELDPPGGFGFDHLAVYRLKLLILESRKDRRRELGRTRFNTAVDALFEDAVNRNAAGK